MVERKKEQEEDIKKPATCEKTNKVRDCGRDNMRKNYCKQREERK
jgi:hypothetical protein